MAQVSTDGTLREFQQFNAAVYGLPDDRMYSVGDLLTQMQRFAMRSIKGIRKGDRDQLAKNLLVSLSFLVAIANRLHIDIEDVTWRRFPRQCSYCAHCPCACSTIKPTARPELRVDPHTRPHTIREFQQMFNAIYPSARRTLFEVGVHLAEEVGEVTEAVHNFLGQHEQHQFGDVSDELADCVSCMMGVANSAHLDVAQELADLFTNNCHVCHKAPCVCTFAVVSTIKL